MIGDSVERDVIDAQQVGIRGVRSNPHREVARAGRHWRVVTRLADLPSLLNGGSSGGVGIL